MAMIKCPECGNQVSNAAKACPVCGFPIAQSNSNVVKISIDQNPDVFGCLVPIKNDITGALIVNAHAGSVATIYTDKPLSIRFCGVTGLMTMCTALVKPGKKYRATWGMGLFTARIQNCHEVDIIDA